MSRGVVSIGYKAFFGCTSSKPLTFEEDIELEVIANSAFYGLRCIKSVDIPDSVNRIEKSAFGCCGAESITIGEGVEYIGWYAFQYCGFLKSITITKGLKTLSQSAFQHCAALESVIYEEDCQLEDSVGWKKAKHYTYKTISLDDPEEMLIWRGRVVREAIKAR